MIKLPFKTYITRGSWTNLSWRSKLGQTSSTKMNSLDLGLDIERAIFTELYNDKKIFKINLHWFRLLVFYHGIKKKIK